jgi:glutathione S-transferase
MKLFGAPQTRSFRMLWMLEECGADYEQVFVDIRSGAQKTPQYHAINPLEKVPALADGEAVVAESGAICAYLADRFPDAGLAPAIGDPARGRYLQWLFFSGSCVEPSYMEKFMGLSANESTSGWGSHERVLGVLDEAVRSGPWLLGERFSGADVMIGADLYYGVRMFKIIEPRPAFDSYIDRCLARPAFERARARDETWGKQGRL